MTGLYLTTMSIRPFLAALLCLHLTVDVLSQKLSPVSLKIGYRQLISQGPIINSGNGLYFEPHLHLDRNFKVHPKITLFAGWGWQDRLRSTSFAQKFAGDYRAEVFSERNSGLSDSAIIHQSAGFINNMRGKSGLTPGCNTNSFHDYELYYGLGYEWPGPMNPVLRVFRGALRSHYQGAADGYDYEIYQFRRNYWGFDLSVSKAFLATATKKGIRPGIGIFAMISNLRTATIYYDNGDMSRKILLRNFVSDHFSRTYAHELRSGLRVFLIFE